MQQCVPLRDRDTVPLRVSLALMFDCGDVWLELALLDHLTCVLCSCGYVDCIRLENAKIMRYCNITDPAQKNEIDSFCGPDE